MPSVAAAAQGTSVPPPPGPCVAPAAAPFPMPPDSKVTKGGYEWHVMSSKEQLDAKLMPRPAPSVPNVNLYAPSSTGEMVDSYFRDYLNCTGQDLQDQVCAAHAHACVARPVHGPYK